MQIAFVFTCRVCGLDDVRVRWDSSHGEPVEQLPNGVWTSKLGKLEDIEHQRLEGLTGGGFAYGSVRMFLRKHTT